ncbi:ATP-binding cassette domain-containing protein [Nonomuraea zeae]|uniref:ATP-binding cassette domain-containing protein n=1 Tax=Nonomuraea zeae TaxID=1642303 RepID=A0A5S4F5T9_9ACTN|nr:ATP-binding cassette domain-containing protein [Nonomuraea zeae]
MIEAHRLTKRFQRTVAVDDLSFTVPPGKITGFLGANGAGKTTTMRLILGLDRPTSGLATVGGVPYQSLARPLTQVGALLDATAVQGGRRAEQHLRWLARANGISPRRIGGLLDRVGLGDAGGKRIGGFSLGMKQRLGMAAALLGDPAVLVLDEPINGLDPEGIRWTRDLLKSLAAEGRTVLVSSHLMNEMAVTADHLIVIGQGRLLADAGIDELVRPGLSLEDVFLEFTSGGRP